MRRSLAVLAVLALASCAEPGSDSTSTPVTISDAAHAGEARYGVPADLTLAVAYTETHWQLPVASVGGEGHAPGTVGIGGIRPWADGDRVGNVARALGVTEADIATDAVTGTLATAATLRDLAVARYGAVPSPDSAQWAEVLADYAALESPAARDSYARDVLATLSRGISATACGGERITVAPRSVSLPDVVATRAALGSADYDPAHWVAASSSNYTDGRGRAVDCIVIHDMEGSYASAISWFQNPAAMASAAYCIRSSDGDITQMVHENDTAWHAGNWEYNQRCIGIEHEGYAADPSWYTETMYASSATLVRHLCEKYGIPMDRDHIIGHAEVPDPYHAGEYGGAGHHTDPGSGWNWSHYMDLVRGTPALPAYDASFVGQSIPSDMTSGERAVAWVELRNDGSREWSISSTLLGTQMPMDHASAFFDAVNWVNDHRATGADHSGYTTGVTGRFTFMITAPEVAADTDVTEHFQLVEEGVTWFGPDVPVTVHVHARASTAPPDAGVAEVDGGEEIPSGDASVAGDAGAGGGRAFMPAHGGCCAVAGSESGVGGAGGVGLAVALVGLVVARRARPARRTR